MPAMHAHVPSGMSLGLQVLGSSPQPLISASCNIMIYVSERLSFGCFVMEILLQEYMSGDSATG